MSSLLLTFTENPFHQLCHLIPDRNNSSWSELGLDLSEISLNNNINIRVRNLSKSNIDVTLSKTRLVIVFQSITYLRASEFPYNDQTALPFPLLNEEDHHSRDPSTRQINLQWWPPYFLVHNATWEAGSTRAATEIGVSNFQAKSLNVFTLSIL